MYEDIPRQLMMVLNLFLLGWGSDFAWGWLGCLFVGSLWFGVIANGSVEGDCGGGFDLEGGCEGGEREGGEGEE